MRFNSRELGVKLAGTERDGDTCGQCTNCTTPTDVQSVPCGDEHCAKETRRPEKKSPEKKSASHLAGLELLRAQMRESLGSAAR